MDGSEVGEEVWVEVEAIGAKDFASDTCGTSLGWNEGVGGRMAVDTELG